MIDVEQHGLCALEQDALAGQARVIELSPARADEGQDFRRDLGQRPEKRCRVDLVGSGAAAKRVVVRQQPVDFHRQALEIFEIHDSEGSASDFVFIGRSDAAFGRAKALHGVRGFAHLVQLAMDRQHQDRVLRHDQRVGRDLHAGRSDARDLLKQRPGIDHDAVADDGALLLDDARGKQRELVGLVADDDGMAGIVAALEAHDHLGPVGEPIDDLAFAFVAPLGADHCDVGHNPYPD